VARTPVPRARPFMDNKKLTERDFINARLRIGSQASLSIEGNIN
jgi:hypothetical protein